MSNADRERARQRMRFQSRDLFIKWLERESEWRGWGVTNFHKCPYSLTVTVVAHWQGKDVNGDNWSQQVRITHEEMRDMLEGAIIGKMDSYSARIPKV